MNDWVKKRILKEVQDFQDYHILSEENIIWITYKKKQFKVNLSNNYPFRPPNCFLKDGTKMNYSPQTFPKRIYNIYKKQELVCMCCNNIMCPDRWSPMRRLIHIFDEYNQFIDNLKILYKKEIIKQLKLPDDMIFYISSFL
jgi:hypothetical protein